MLRAFGLEFSAFHRFSKLMSRTYCPYSSMQLLIMSTVKCSQVFVPLPIYMPLYSHIFSNGLCSFTPNHWQEKRFIVCALVRKLSSTTSTLESETAYATSSASEPTTPTSRHYNLPSRQTFPLQLPAPILAVTILVILIVIVIVTMIA